MSEIVPPSRRSRLVRLVHWARHQPRSRKWAALLVLLLAVGGLGYYFVDRRAQNATRQAILESWKQFDAAAKTGDDVTMNQALEEILTLNPAETLALSRKQALATGSAAPDDEPMIVFCLHRLISKNDFPAAEREAHKRLALQPKDWLARAFLAHMALTRDDMPRARKELQALPEPTDREAHVTPLGLLLAFELHARVGKPADHLRKFVRDVYVERMGSPDVQQFPTLVRVQVLECYLEGFEPDPAMPIPAGLSRGWDGARRLVRACLDAETDPALLKRLGILSARLRNALLTLKQASQISENQLPDLLQKHDRLTQEIWEKLRSVDPRDQDAHHGLSLLALRQQRFPEAWTLARAGLTLHPDHPGLLAIQSFLLRLDERPREAYLQSKAAAEAGKDAALWLITAESAAVIPDRDAAIAACERALDLDPHLHYATRFLARLLREAGDPHAAVQRLRTLPEKSLFADPLTVRDYVTSLLQAGLALHLEEVFQNLEQHATSTRSSAVLAAGFLGAAESPLTATIARSLTMLSERAEKRWPEDTELTVARSALAYALAEQLEPAWDPQRTRTATTLLERARTLAPADRDTAARLTWLQLQGQTNPAEAQRAAARLRTDFAQQEVLSPFQSLVLAACERQNGNPQQALVVIQRALGAHLPSAGLWIEKAFCHHDLKNQDEARQALSNAQVLQRNGREQVEYLKAVEKLKGENR